MDVSDISNRMNMIILTTQNLADDQDFQVWCKEQDEDEGNHQDERSNRRYFVTIPIRSPTGNEQSEYLASASSIRETRLPCCRDGPFVCSSIVCSILPIELWGGVETSEKRKIIPYFH